MGRGHRPALNLSICIQHHPARAHLLGPLLERLGGAELVTDPEPDSAVRSAFRTYLECLRRTPDDATHRLVVQDDAWPCTNFRERAEAAIAEHPGALVPLFVPMAGAAGRAVARARDRGLSWATIPITWVPTVALSWPVALARDYLAFAEERWDPARQRGDDSPVGVWRARSKAAAFAPVPSLVEHPDVVDSLFRKRKGQAGRNKARVAVTFEE